MADFLFTRRTPRRAQNLWAAWLCGLSIIGATHAASPPAETYPSADPLVLEAREAHRRKDRTRLQPLREQALTQTHPLASWVDYWSLNLRLSDATPDEVSAFFQRWPSTYVEDRLRNDWLLELGRRKAWEALLAELPKFRMNDDREVHCWALAAEQATRTPASKNLATRAEAAWLAQRDADEGCRQMAQQLHHAGLLEETAVWRKVLASVEINRPRAARAAVTMLGPRAEALWSTWYDSAGASLEAWATPAAPSKSQSKGPRKAAKDAKPATRIEAPPHPRWLAIAFVRLAQQSPSKAAALLDTHGAKALGPGWLAWTWAQVGRQSALQLQGDAEAAYRRAWEARDQADAFEPWSDEVLAWGVRAALRSGDGVSWRLVARSVEAMAQPQTADGAWVYWAAQAQLNTAREGDEGKDLRERAIASLRTLASPLHFYAQLALEQVQAAPPPAAVPPPLGNDELRSATDHPGLTRALRLMALGLRGEGIREWNFSLIGMNDRQLRAAAQRACDREVWDRCINTSDRTRKEIDLAQRFPTPFKAEVLQKTSDIGVDPAFVYGLIRQESRFLLDARSHVGASGLMQVMPATAQWTAKRIGMPYRAEMLSDRDANLRLGMSYLKLVLDDFEGSQPLAAAGYNAGPNRPRRWREGSTVDAAAWAEAIPFHETRDYVKKVLSNATLYAQVLGLPSTSLRNRLGATVGPRAVQSPQPIRELP